jgi:hypothetical protein
MGLECHVEFRFTPGFLTDKHKFSQADASRVPWEWLRVGRLSLDTHSRMETQRHSGYELQRPWWPRG